MMGKIVFFSILKVGIYPAQTITDVDYADDKALLANAPDQAEFLLHSLEREAGGISLNVNADKTVYMCFNQRGDTSILNGRSLKLASSSFEQGSNLSRTHPFKKKRFFLEAMGSSMMDVKT